MNGFTRGNQSFQKRAKKVYSIGKKRLSLLLLDSALDAVVGLTGGKA